MGDGKVTAMKAFRENLRREMKLAGVSQRELAKRSDVTHVHINRILVGKTEPTLEICDRLATAIGKPLQELIMPAHKGRSVRAAS